MRRILNEYNDDDGESDRSSLVFVKSYIKQLVETGNEIDGLPCYQCHKMILPGEYCYSKSWQKVFLRYCHKQCIENLYK